MSSGPGQVVVVGRAQEPEAVGQHLEHAFREDEAALLGLRLEDLEDQLLLAHAGRAGDGEVLGDLRELLDALVLQLGDVEALAAPALSCRPPPGRLRRAAAAGAAARGPLRLPLACRVARLARLRLVLRDAVAASRAALGAAVRPRRRAARFGRAGAVARARRSGASSAPAASARWFGGCGLRRAVGGLAR